ADLAMGKIARGEWAWAAGFAVLVMAATTLPYLAGGLSQTDGWRFGGFVLGVEDGNSYIAKMGQGARGAWLFTLPYSSEPQRGVPLFEFHLLLGKLAGPEHDAQVWVYHLARIIFGFALLLVSYLFLSEFLPDVRNRRLGLVLVALGGGLGWLLALFGLDHLFGSLPVDFYSPEAYTFLILYALPHLAAARCLFLLGLLAYLRGRGVVAGLALLAASLIQPLSVLVAWVVIGIDSASAWLFPYLRFTFHLPPSTLHAPRSILNALTAILLSSPFVLYTLYLFSADPLLKQWNAQNVLPSPHPLHYVFGYGVLAVFGVGGWRALARRKPELARFVAGWALAVPFLLYAPLTTQRRLIEGFQLPLVALAVLGIANSVGSARKRGADRSDDFSRQLPGAPDAQAAAPRQFHALLIIILSVPTSAILLAGGIAAARAPAEPLFHPADQLAALDWLSHHAQPGEVVLSSFETGNALPAYTPLVAYIGHGPESVFLAQKLPRVAAFYRRSTDDAGRRRLLADGRIAFVIFGPHERALGDFDPNSVDYLRGRFTSGDYAVYEVTP
ncbi:MAG: hypothetical protein HW418_4015, partial [Anaerolineales bacterium]|nr:hypothetical protein [Anaerolineales bacterium]